MGRHSINTEIDGNRINVQVRDEIKAELAADHWDHDMCGDGEVCSDECPFND